MRLFLMTSALAFACVSAAPAAELHPGAPLAAIPSFTLTIPGFATWGGSITTEYAPTGPVQCPVTINYNAKVTLTSLTNNVVAGQVSYSWAPNKSLANMYQINAAQSGQSFGGATTLETAQITYLASTPPEGTPVTFSATVSGGAKLTAEELRVITHVTCTNGRVRQ